MTVVRYEAQVLLLTMRGGRSGAPRRGRGYGRGSGNRQSQKYEDRRLDEEAFVLKLYKAKFGVSAFLQCARRTDPASPFYVSIVAQVNNQELSAELLHDQLKLLFKAALWQDGQMMSTKKELNAAKTRIDGMTLECVC